MELPAAKRSLIRLYTEDHEKLLGHAKEEWKHIGRVYDDPGTSTCHQCRQKTGGPRSYCKDCLKKYQFCGDCLYARYGENVNEALGDMNWKCPVCRDICNCSRCRQKKGWLPTGPMVRQALELGYKSVAHFLILTRRSGTNVNFIDAVTAKGFITISTEQFGNVQERKRKKKREVDIIVVEDEDEA